jgi:uncharacterized membrane protein
VIRKFILSKCGAALTMFIIMTSCRHEPLPIFPDNGGGGGGNGGGGTTPPSTAICFESQVLPLYQSNCAMAGCHDAISHAEGYVLDSYLNITKRGISPGKPNSSKLYTILSNGMPPRGYTPLTALQKGVIAQWITEGAKNTTNCNTSCDTTQFAYAANISPLIQLHCNGCHSTASAAGSGASIILDNHTDLQNYANNGRLMGSLNHLAGYSAMPKGQNQLDACELRIIQKWKDAGTPNN